MSYWFLGIKYGIFLSLLVGPLLVVLVHTTMEKGIRYGILVGSGIWISDILCVLLCFFALYLVEDWLRRRLVIPIIGIIDGCFLLIMGIYVWLQ